MAGAALHALLHEPLVEVEHREEEHRDQGHRLDEEPLQQRAEEGESRA